MLGAFFLRAERIHLELHGTDAERLPHASEHHDDFGVDVRAFHTERFGAKLMELAIAAALRTFVTEHRPPVPEALRGAVEQIVFVNGTHDRGCAFRAERKLVTVHRVGVRNTVPFQRCRLLRPRRA